MAASAVLRPDKQLGRDADSRRRTTLAWQKVPATSIIEISFMFWSPLTLTPVFTTVHFFEVRFPHS